MSAWQSIETALKGGFPDGFTGERLTTDPAWVEPPRILAWSPTRGLLIVYWDWYYADGGNGYVSGRTAWVNADGEALWQGDAPTVWMPLPAPQDRRRRRHE